MMATFVYAELVICPLHLITLSGDVVGCSMLCIAALTEPLPDFLNYTRSLQCHRLSRFAHLPPLFSIALLSVLFPVGCPANIGSVQTVFAVSNSTVCVMPTKFSADQRTALLLYQRTHTEPTFWGTVLGNSA